MPDPQTGPEADPAAERREKARRLEAALWRTLHLCLLGPEYVPPFLWQLNGGILARHVEALAGGPCPNSSVAEAVEVTPEQVEPGEGPASLEDAMFEVEMEDSFAASDKDTVVKAVTEIVRQAGKLMDVRRGDADVLGHAVAQAVAVYCKGRIAPFAREMDKVAGRVVR